LSAEHEDGDGGRRRVVRAFQGASSVEGQTRGDSRLNPDGASRAEPSGKTAPGIAGRGWGSCGFDTGARTSVGIRGGEPFSRSRVNRGAQMVGELVRASNWGGRGSARPERIFRGRRNVEFRIVPFYRSGNPPTRLVPRATPKAEDRADWISDPCWRKRERARAALSRPNETYRLGAVVDGGRPSRRSPREKYESRGCGGERGRGQARRTERLRRFLFVCRRPSLAAEGDAEGRRRWGETERSSFPGRQPTRSADRGTARAYRGGPARSGSSDDPPAPRAQNQVNQITTPRGARPNAQRWGPKRKLNFILDHKCSGLRREPVLDALRSFSRLTARSVGTR